jgi:hypothetical protein
MSPRKKTGPEDEPEDDGEEPEGGEAAEDGGGDSSDGESLESHIRGVVEEVVGGLLGRGDKRPDGPPAGGPPAGGARADEQSIMALVKEAQGKLKAEEDRDARLKGVADEVESLKKVVERPPARSGLAGRVQAFLWGAE